MRRKKSRAKRPVTRSTGEDAADIVDNSEAGPSKNEEETAEPEPVNETEKDVIQEIDCSKEEFEEVDYVVSSVMEMDSIIERNDDNVAENKPDLTDDGIIVKNELDLELGKIEETAIENCEEAEETAIENCEEAEETSIENCDKAEETAIENCEEAEETAIENCEEAEETVIENCEEAKYHENAEQKSIEEEPSATLHEHINDGEKEKGTEQNEDIVEVSDVNEVAPSVFNHDDSLPKKKLGKQLEIHVGGLHKETVEQDLFEIFGNFGEVKSANIIRDRKTKKSKGFAFIKYATPEQTKKVVSYLKDGIEVKGKLAKLSISRDRDVLYLGLISKTWTKEDVLAKLKDYGIENIDNIHVPIDLKKDKNNKGFAFLIFNSFSDALAALQHLRKQNAVFGNKKAKVAFARSETPMHTREEVRLQVKTIYVEGIPKSWDVHKLKEICEQCAETKKVTISRNLGNKGKDFGFISFFTRGDAVACVEVMNKLRYEGDVKVKAYIARPLVQMRMRKSSCVRLKFNKRHRNTHWWKMKAHARCKGAERESDVKTPSARNKSKVRGIKEKPAAVVYKNNQDPLNSKPTIEGKTNEQQNIAPEARNAETGLSTNPKRMRNNRSERRQRRRMPEKTEGTSQGRHSRSSRPSRRTKSKPRIRNGHSRGADSVDHRLPSREAYPASTSGYRVSAYGAITGSKRPSSYMEPSVGFMQPVNHNDQYHAEYVTPAFRHQRQPYAGYLKPDTHYERQPPAKYLKPAIENDALPHAGYLESPLRKQSYDVYDNPTRRIVRYSGPDNQRPIYGAGSAYSRPYVPNDTSYARYEAGSSGGGGHHSYSGAYPPRRRHY